MKDAMQTVFTVFLTLLLTDVYNGCKKSVPASLKLSAQHFKILFLFQQEELKQLLKYISKAIYKFMQSFKLPRK